MRGNEGVCRFLPLPPLLLLRLLLLLLLKRLPPRQTPTRDEQCLHFGAHG